MAETCPYCDAELTPGRLGGLCWSCGEPLPGAVTELPVKWEEPGRPAATWSGRSLDVREGREFTRDPGGLTNLLRTLLGLNVFLDLVLVGLEFADLETR